MNPRPPLSDAASAQEQAFASYGKRTGAVLPGMSPAEAFSVLAAPMVAQVAQRVDTLVTSDDPESLHKLRVALRRLRSLWWAYDPLIDRPQAKRQQCELKALADSAGRTRDWDILKHLLAEDTRVPCAFTTLVERVELLRADALLRSRATIAAANVDAMMQQQIANVLLQLEACSFDEPLAAFATSRVALAKRALQKRMQRALAEPAPGYDALHEVRIAGKKLRYLQEFFAPLIDNASQIGIVELTGLQDELGKLNDIVTSEALLVAHADQLGEHVAAQAATSYLRACKEQSLQRVDALLREMSGMFVNAFPGIETS